jgi:hypothetical protein
LSLILTAATGYGVYQASDRRLTKLDGSLFDDESNKAICVDCRNARFVIGYTGLAFIGTLSTDVWLVEFLTRIKAGRLGLEAISIALKEGLTDAFRRIRVRTEYRALTVVIAGFRKSDSVPVVGFISNLKNADSSTAAMVRDQFEKFAILPGKGQTKKNYLLLNAEGTVAGITKPIERQFTKLKKKRFFQRSDQLIVRKKLVDLLRAAAGTKEAHGLIGRSCMSVAIKMHSAGIESSYHPTDHSPRDYAPHFVGPNASFWNIRIWKGGNPPDGWWLK